MIRVETIQGWGKNNHYSELNKSIAQRILKTNNQNTQKGAIRRSINLYNYFLLINITIFLWKKKKIQSEKLTSCISWHETLLTEPLDIFWMQRTETKITIRTNAMRNIWNWSLFFTLIFLHFQLKPIKITKKKKSKIICPEELLLFFFQLLQNWKYQVFEGEDATNT